VDIADEKLFTLEAESFFGNIDLCIDHHPSNTFYAKNTYLDSSASATGILVYRLIMELGVSMDKDIAEAVYLACATDTGCFKYSNTTPECHVIAAECMKAGADFHHINTQFFVVKTPARLAIEGEIFSRLVTVDDGKIAISVLSRDFIDGINATSDDMDNLSSLLMQIESALCGMLLTENTEKDNYRLSIRTREGSSACNIGLLFDGGGHQRAAGGRIEGKLEDCIGRLIKAAREDMEKNV
jgi:phosphoesterase RecJ-like protein